MHNLLEDYNCINECNYQNEHYSVRDNGAVLRHTPNNKRARPTDNKWTFGRLNFNTGYLEIASKPIHRIVATAFNGKPPTKEHVVDHIDTNRQNNRPDNLRWVTRLENVLLNPITARKIEIQCGCSIDEFISDIPKHRDKLSNSNYSWMRTVSNEEAQSSYERMLEWAESKNSPSGGSLGDWIFNRSSSNTKNVFDQELTLSITPNVRQKNWKTPTEFPSCPQTAINNYIVTYFTNLKTNEIFSRNQHSTIVVEESAISKDSKTLWVIGVNSEDNAIKPYTLTEVNYVNDFYVHNSLGSFFTKDGAEKQFTLSQGLQWTKCETFDELC